ncbi:MATE family efflux transporter [Gemella palaticanis]|uniref:Multidrug export protein MepA n=2 Tax=Gemelliphila palaticanis TaxID=81950 RepID=A0ABX2T061_9BACL|nr:MATE family efflux transporter [Gemella palaticanis]NYS47959.1 MATE family efflux transporter [Gemella palaticanis]
MREKMKQKENPLGYMPLGKLLKNMAIPAIIANIVNALYNIVDQIFIGHYIGYLGNAATTIAFPITTICLSLGVMIGIGTAANFNLSLGKKEVYRAEKIVGSSFLFTIFIGILLCLLIRFNIDNLLYLFGATDDIFNYAKEYVSITTYGIPFYLITLATNPLIRADRSPKYAMFTVLIGAVLNIILDFIFVAILDKGISGAAIATVLSQIVSAIFVLNYYKHFKSITILKSNFKIKFNLIKDIIYLGMASFVFQISTTIIQITTNNVLKFYGNESIYGSDIPIAVSGIVAKINVIFVAIILGIVQGSQPIVSFNYGAKKYLRVRDTYKKVVSYAAVISLIFFTLFQTFPKNIISIFGSGSELYFEFGVSYMRYFMLFMFLNGVLIASSTFFSSIGKAQKGVFITITKQIFILLPTLILLPKMMGINGIFYAVPTADLFSFFIAITFIYIEFKKMPNVNEG